MQFPVFVQPHSQMPVTLYQIMIAQVPDVDQNTPADSYTEVQVHKP